MVTRHEKVVLDLEDRFSPKAVRAGLVTEALANSLDRAGSSSRDADRDLGGLASSADKTAVSTRRADGSINQLTGRLRLMADAAAILGPGLIPIGAVGVAGLAGLASTAGLATVGVLGLVAASQGLGTALEAVQKARLDPTVANIQAANEAMSQLAPQARDFVTEFQRLRPVLTEIRDAGAAGFFPGLTESLDAVDRAAPGLERLLEAIGSASGEGIGGLISGAAGDTEFLDYLTAEVPDAISSLIDLTGTLAHGMSRLFMSLDPGTDGLLGWVNDVADGFDQWASSAQGRQDVQAFLDYAAENGPRVAEFFGSLVETGAQIVQAYAPLGGPTLQVLTAVSDVVGDIADSDLGTPLAVAAAGLAVFNRAAAVTKSLGGSAAGGLLAPVGAGLQTYGRDLKASVPTLRQAGTYLQYLGQGAQYASEQTLAARSSVRGFVGQVARGAGPIAGLAVLTSGAADGIGLTNTASLALAGSFGGPVGTAIGAGAGLFLDIKSAANESSDAVDALHASLASGDIVTAGQQYSDLVAKYKDLTHTTGVGDFFGDVGGVISSAFGPHLYSEINATENQLVSLTEVLNGVSEATGSGGISQDITSNFADLQRVLTSAQPALDSLGISLDDLYNADGAQATRYISQISNEMERLDSRAGRVDGVKYAFAGLDDQLLTTADSAAQVAAALGGLLDPQLNASNASIAWRDSLRGLNDQLADNSRQIFGQSAAADQNKAAINGSIASLKDMISAQAANGASSVQLSRKLRQGRQDLIAVGKAAGFAEDDFRKYLRTQGLTPRLIKTQVTASGTAKAQSDTKKVRAAYAALPASVRVLISTPGIATSRKEAVQLAHDLDLSAKERKALITVIASQAKKDTGDVSMMLGNLDKQKPSVTPTVNPGPAQQSISAINSSVAHMPDGYITIHVTRAEKHAAGGLVGGLYDFGGQVRGPGGPTDDRVQTMLSNREYVMPVSAVDHYGLELMEDIRARRLNLEALASGGLPDRDDYALAVGEESQHPRLPRKIPTALAAHRPRGATP